MPKGNRLLYAVLGGCAVIAMMLSAIWLYSRQPRQPDDIANRQYDIASQSAENWFGAVKEYGLPSAVCGEGEGTSNCSEQYSTAHDLTAQWAAANAARRLVWLTEIQTAIAFFGLLGVGFTVWLTNRNAKAAVDGVNVSLEALRLESRGYLAVESFKFHRAKWNTPQGTGVEGFFIFAEFKNFGKAPAIVTRNIVSTRVIKKGDSAQIDWTDAVDHPRTRVHLAPGTGVKSGELILTLLSLSKIYKEEMRVLYMFKLEYCDMFTGKHYFHTHQSFELKISADPYILFKDEKLDPSQYMLMEARGEYDSAS